VVSALEGVTDALIEATHLAKLSNRRGFRRIIATQRARHLALVDQLPLNPTTRNALQADLDRLLFDMLDILQAVGENPSDELMADVTDRVTSVGERLAARIVAALLRQNNLRGVALDATDIIVTDNVYGNAQPNMPLTRERITNNVLPMLDRDIVPVITGFIGATKTGQPTTLGRGGSDYTASILGICAETDAVWIWTDVDGLMSADPREVHEAQTIAHLSYEEAAELAYFGARILHPRTIAPLQEQQIPLWIKNVFKPQQAGTHIDHASANPNTLKAVTSIQGLGLRAARSGPLSEISRLVDDTLFAVTGSHADVMISSQSSTQSFVCFVIPTSAGPDAIHSAQQALEEALNEHPDMQTWQVHPVSIITVIGAMLDSLAQHTASILQVLEGTRILALAQGPSHCSLSVVVNPQDAQDALLHIHQLILKAGERKK
ncbi:MAG: aspartate kinase, partial [Burkholderiales bacterium]|nr:aspartate kinase [Anaerolineae bacterium]